MLLANTEAPVTVRLEEPAPLTMVAVPAMLSEPKVKALLWISSVVPVAKLKAPAPPLNAAPAPKRNVPPVTEVRPS